jgi:hypothetical protein
VRTESGGSSYQPVAPEPLALQGTFAFEVVQAPENALHQHSGLFGLLAGAGAGDELLVEQFNEPLRWAGGTQLNPRLAGYLAAARRGARVRVLLDRYYADPLDPNGNYATVAYLNAVARAEGLDLEARLGNPAGLGIHNKMVLVRRGGAGTVHVGSLNGSETAAKINREVALQVQSDRAYAYLAAVFAADWAAGR